MAADTSGPGPATAPSSHFKAFRDSGRSQAQTHPAARRAAPRGSARLPRSPAPLTAAAGGAARPGRAPPSAPDQVPRGKAGKLCSPRPSAELRGCSRRPRIRYRLAARGDWGGGARPEPRPREQPRRRRCHAAPAGTDPCPPLQP